MFAIRSFRAVVSAGVRTVIARPRVPVKLLQDVHNLGKAGDVVKVKAGYARNFLASGKNKRAEYAVNATSLVPPPQASEVCFSCTALC